MNQMQSPGSGLNPNPGERRVDGSVSGHEKAEVQVGWKMAGLGMQVACEVLAGMLLGWLWDKWRGGTTGIKIGAVLGIGIGLWTLVKGALKLNKQLDLQHPTKGRGQPIPYSDDDATLNDHGNDADDNSDPNRRPRGPAQR